MDKDTRYMSNRQIALELLQRQQQERINNALKAWQPFFEQQAQQANTAPATLNLRNN